jgi:cation diffusion facilitator CzcD-associated flavoprotein CzcO
LLSYVQGHGYLEALSSDNVDVKTDSITKATGKGLVLSDGSLLAADAIVCATGFDTSYKPSFPVVAFGKDLRDLWQSEPRSYFSIAATGVPNYFSESFRPSVTFRINEPR